MPIVIIYYVVFESAVFESPEGDSSSELRNSPVVSSRHDPPLFRQDAGFI